MMTPVNKVLVADTFTTADVMAGGFPLNTLTIVGMESQPYSALSNGDTFRFARIKDYRDITLVDGTVQNIPILDYGNPISKEYLKSEVDAITPLVDLAGAGTNFIAPVEDVITIDLSNLHSTGIIFPGNRYVLRLQFRDYYELVAPYSRSYEVIADATTTLASLAIGLAARVNSDRYGRAQATVAGNVITLVGLYKPDNNGVYSLNEFSMTELFASLYFTTPRDSILFNNYYQDANAPAIKVNGTMGRGYWKVVRDRENRALGYRGFTNRTWFPVIHPKLWVREGGQYDTIVLEQERMFLSNDNQYRKNTPLTDEVYITAGTGPAVANAIIPLIS